VGSRRRRPRTRGLFYLEPRLIISEENLLADLASIVSKCEGHGRIAVRLNLNDVHRAVRQYATDARARTEIL